MVIFFILFLRYLKFYIDGGFFLVSIKTNNMKTSFFIQCTDVQVCIDFVGVHRTTTITAPAVPAIAVPSNALLVELFFKISAFPIKKTTFFLPCFIEILFGSSLLLIKSIYNCNYLFGVVINIYRLRQFKY